MGTFRGPVRFALSSVVLPLFIAFTSLARGGFNDNAGAAAFLASASAPGATADAPGDVGNFAPLNQKQSWTYQGTEQIAGQAPIAYSNTVSVDGAKLIGTVLATVVKETNALNGGAAESYYVKSNRGLTYYGSNDSNDTLTPQVVPHMTLRFPLGIGSTFTQLDRKGLNVRDQDFDGLPERLDIVATVTVKGFESVSVPAGTFANSTKVETRSTFTVNRSRGSQVVAQATETVWLFPGVGQVKRVLQSGDATVTETLSAFTRIHVVDLANRQPVLVLR